MPRISQSEIDYLRSQSYERDEWSYSKATYYALDEGRTIYDEMTREVISSFEPTYKAGVDVYLKLRVINPSLEDKLVPAHRETRDYEITVSVEQLDRLGITPNVKDKIHVENHGYFYVTMVNTHNSKDIANSTEFLDYKLNCTTAPERGDT